MTSSMSAMGMPTRCAFYLCILQHHNVLGDAIHLHVILVHIGAERDHNNGVEPPAVGVEEGHDLEGRHLSVEGVGIHEVVVPDFINGVTEKFGGPALGCLVTAKVVEAGFVGRFCADANDCGGIIDDGATVERQAERMDKGGAMIRNIPCRVCEEAHEGIDPPS